MMHGSTNVSMCFPMFLYEYRNASSFHNPVPFSKYMMVNKIDQLINPQSQCFWSDLLCEKPAVV